MGADRHSAADAFGDVADMVPEKAAHEATRQRTMFELRV
jgi:hypothetical protein